MALTSKQESSLSACGMFACAPAIAFGLWQTSFSAGVWMWFVMFLCLAVSDVYLTKHGR